MEEMQKNMTDQVRKTKRSNTYIQKDFLQQKSELPSPIIKWNYIEPQKCQEIV